MAVDPILVVFGGASIGNRDPFLAEKDLETAFSTLEAHHVTKIDSAQAYGNSEQRLGEVQAGQRFAIDTKWRGGFLTPGWATKETIINTAEESIKKLGVKKVDIFYMHSPDPQVPLEETLAGVNEIYQRGLFSRFGLSNYEASEVEKVHSICTANKYVLPSVYQGHYNVIARLQESALFPTLRRLDIAFYAYSPLAGGFLTKTAKQIQDADASANRFASTVLYRNMYVKESYLAALAKWEQVAADAGCSRAELAYRWIAYHSPLERQRGDGLIFGARSLEQLEETLVGIERGPLPDTAVRAIDDIWEGIKHEAPLDPAHP